MSSSRFLAPVALLGAIGAVAVVIATSSGGSQTSTSAPAATATATTTQAASTSSGRGSYTVRAGDTLSGIAEKTGVSVEDLSKINAPLDPQSLRTGQKLRLNP